MPDLIMHASQRVLLHGPGFVVLHKRVMETELGETLRAVSLHKRAAVVDIPLFFETGRAAARKIASSSQTIG